MAYFALLIINQTCMKKIILTFLLLLMVMAQPATAQTKDSTSTKAPVKPPLFGIAFSGFVNTDFIFDSRQTVMARDGDWLFYPDAVKPDAQGKDINARGTFTILSILTRLTGTITGPDIFKAKSSGYIEGEFYGNAPANINSFRLRHAYIRLNWPGTELLFGQYWHPMFVPSCFPETISLNTGAPFLVFSRNPQIRLTQKLGNFKVVIAANSQLDATSTGPDGPNTKYLRQSLIPELNFQVQYGLKNEKSHTEFLIGAGIDYLSLMPLLNTSVLKSAAWDSVKNGVVVHHDAVYSIYKTNTTISSVVVNFFTKLQLAKVTIKAGAVYGGNCYALNMIGGYAVKSVVDPSRGIVDYTNITTASVWTDFKTNGTRWSPGIYGAFSKNLGSSDIITGAIYSRGANIDYIYRIAPRLSLTVKKLKLSSEFDYTVAAYGKTMPNGTVSNSKEIGNFRVLIGVFYFF